MMKNQSGKVNSAMVAVITLVSVLWLGCQPPNNPSQDGGVDEPGSNQPYSVSVDYSRTLVEMAEAGQYDWSNNAVSWDIIVGWNLQTQQSNAAVSVEIALINLEKDASTSDVLQYVDKLDPHPRFARIEEILAFGEKYPDVQREFLVFAFGSFWIDQDGVRYVPFLYKNDYGNRYFGFARFDNMWGKNCLFMVISEQGS